MDLNSWSTAETRKERGVDDINFDCLGFEHWLDMELTIDFP